MKQIPLYGQYGLGKFALVDDEDFEELNKYRWFGVYVRTSSNIYVVRNIKSNDKWTGRRLHQIIMKPEKGQIIDHIDGNTLNNQKSNLRICTPQQNSSNKRKYKNGSSKYKGVTLDKSHRGENKYYRWQVRIQINKKAITLGRFPYTPEGEIEAALCYNEGAKKYFGEFARLNIINDNEREYIEYIPIKQKTKAQIEKENVVKYISTIEHEFIRQNKRLIPLTKERFAIVDLEDYEFLNQYNWNGGDTDYPKRKTKDGYVYMHKLLMNASKGQIVDHIDRNPLNVCKSNLRLATPFQNSANFSTRKNKKTITKYVGVFKRTATSSHTNINGITKTWSHTYWASDITVNYKKIRLGNFPFTPCGELLAALKYDEAALKYKGEFARLNFPT